MTTKTMTKTAALAKAKQLLKPRAIGAKPKAKSVSVAKVTWTKKAEAKKPEPSFGERMKAAREAKAAEVKRAELRTALKASAAIAGKGNAKAVKKAAVEKSRADVAKIKAEVKASKKAASDKRRMAEARKTPRVVNFTKVKEAADAKRKSERPTARALKITDSTLREVKQRMRGTRQTWLLDPAASNPTLEERMSVCEWTFRKLSRKGATYLYSYHVEGVPRCFIADLGKEGRKGNLFEGRWSYDNKDAIVETTVVASVFEAEAFFAEIMLTDAIELAEANAARRAA